MNVPQKAIDVVANNTANNIDDTCNKKKPRSFEEILDADPKLAVKIGGEEDFQQYIKGYLFILFAQGSRHGIEFKNEGNETFEKKFKENADIRSTLTNNDEKAKNTRDFFEQFKGYVFIQRDGSKEKGNVCYYAYNMDYDAAQKKIMEKTSQKFRDSKKKTGSKKKVAHKARASPIKKNAYRKKKDAGHSFRSDGINVEDFLTKEDSLLDDIFKNYEPVIREPSEEEKQLWKEAVRDIPEINTDHITYNPDTYKEDIAKDKVEMKSIFLKALREDDTVLQPLYEGAKHDSVLTYENYIHKYEVPDEEMMEILDGPDFTSINVELNLRFDQLQTFLEFHLSEAAAKHENDSALEPLEDPVLNEDVWDQVNFDNVENK